MEKGTHAIVQGDQAVTEFELFFDTNGQRRTAIIK